ncbi:hypothetical protein RhiirA1_509582 [Rhizophagus irregularis]|uniref:Uncharacterized protein n=1 Tax=Rhizophagus irregularis TaxID=588596 RepID=A0A2I1FCF9_9GLOM|nr:hypothetical protein RhiirA1_509582 [Rhizophagus irregularis]PKY32079.1 hypothetical protein RhiirB3_490817 [Rhizophagus irregularis]
MDVPKYDGNIHPDEWMKDLQKHNSFWKAIYNLDYLNTAISLVDSTIKLPTGIDTYEKLGKALKEDISFTVFKNTNKKMLQLLKYIPESRGKYLSSINNLCDETGSMSQSVFAEYSDPGPNSLWRIKFIKELAAYSDTSITLQHVKSDMFLGINYVSCSNDAKNPYWVKDWKFNHGKVKSYQSFLKSNDIINLSIKKFYDNNGNYISNGQVECLRSHDIQFTIGDYDALQEVCCHNERLGGNDEINTVFNAFSG